MQSTLADARFGIQGFALFATILSSTSPVPGSTLAVTSLDDNGPGTLRQAIPDASPGDTIDFAVTGNIVLTNELVVSTNLTISGPGATNYSRRFYRAVSP